MASFLDMFGRRERDEMRQRLEAVEQDVAAHSQRLDTFGQEIAVQAERLEARERSLAQLVEQSGTLREALDTLSAELGRCKWGTETCVEDLASVKAQSAKFETAVLRLTKELELHQERSLRTQQALAERVELIRLEGASAGASGSGRVSDTEF